MREKQSWRPLQKSSHTTYEIHYTVPFNFGSKTIMMNCQWRIQSTIINGRGGGSERKSLKNFDYKEKVCHNPSLNFQSNFQRKGGRISPKNFLRLLGIRFGYTACSKNLTIVYFDWRVSQEFLRRISYQFFGNGYGIYSLIGQFCVDSAGGLVKVMDYGVRV